MPHLDMSRELVGRELFTAIAYLLATLLFAYGLSGLSKPHTARRGNAFAALGMLLAIVGTLVKHDVVRYDWIVAGVLLGSAIGVPMALRIPMTKMPERIALSHAFGGLAVALVGLAYYMHYQGFVDAHHHVDRFHVGAISFEVFMGAVTFTGSLMAFGKLQGILPGSPVRFPLQNVVTLASIALCATLVVVLTCRPADTSTDIVTLGFYGLLAYSFVLGVLLVLPIGGADMPVVLCLLNSYAGLAASASGFALDNLVLVVCGALDGGSGFVLAMVMSKAMNRSFTNVIFGAFGSVAGGAAVGGAKSASVAVNEASVEDAAEMLRAAASVIVVPGYGMAVAQAQHAVRELAQTVEKHGGRVRYAIHPVAGRMPGHMNVLLAEANVSYDQLYDFDSINDDFANTDVVLVVGANDVVNPAAKTTKGSPIFGMPVFDCDKAKAVLVFKRSMNRGFAGVENELFVHPKTMMVFGDAKQTLQKLAQQLKGDGH